MGHCTPTGGAIRDNGLFPTLPMDPGGALSRCVIYYGSEPIAKATVDQAFIGIGFPGPLKPWLYNTTADYKCFKLVY